MQPNIRFSPSDPTRYQTENIVEQKKVNGKRIKGRTISALETSQMIHLKELFKL